MNNEGQELERTRSQHVVAGREQQNKENVLIFETHISQTKRKSAAATQTCSSQRVSNFDKARI